jgi:hypothetical protein
MPSTIRNSFPPREPFAKRPEGRERRTDRRNVRARKAAWLVG